jgi:hypothetical protein
MTPLTPREKIQQHETLDDLFASIEADNSSREIAARRYPVRFILLDDFRIFQKLAARMRQNGVTPVDLEKLCETDTEAWITQDVLRRVLECGEFPTLPQNATCRASTCVPVPHSILVTPVSEIIRFYEADKFRAFLSDVALFENQNVKRIYIPLIGLRRRFEDFLTTFGRIAESAPVWAVGDGGIIAPHISPVMGGDGTLINLVTLKSAIQPVKVFLLPGTNEPFSFELPAGFECQKSFYAWLRFWKTHAPAERAFFASETLNAFYQNAQPDNIFAITKIENVRDFFEKVLGVRLPFEYSAAEDVHWKRLLMENDWTQRRSFPQFVNHHFNVLQFGEHEIIENWLDPKTDEFGRWLLKKVAVTALPVGSYLHAIFAGNVDLHSGNALLGKVALGIMQMDAGTGSVLQERRKVLSLFPTRTPLSQAEQTALAEFIDTTAETNFDAALQLCTGRFCFECERFITWFKNGKLTLERLKEVYPAVADYFSDMECDEFSPPSPTAACHRQLNDYFAAYKLAKLRDEYTLEIQSSIETLNASAETFWQWHSQFRSAHNLLAAAESAPAPAGERGGIDKIFWLDGVGAEWLPLMLSKIKNSRFRAEQVSLAAAQIPSTTGNNHFGTGDKIRKLDAMDNFAHGALYRYPFSICRELQIVEELLEEIFNEFLASGGWKKIAIVSDHGLSALSRLVEGRNFTRNATHEGREEIVGTEGASDYHYIFRKVRHDGEEKCYRVALKHASLGAKPVREVHGGCTPEEVLVPFIVLARKPDAPAAHRPAAAVSPAPQPPAPATQQQPAQRGFTEEDLF